MKRSKRLITLVAILAVVCVATFALTKYEKKQEEIQNSDAVILEISSDSVESISWEVSEEGLAFHKTEEGWLYDDDEAFPVNEDEITDILSHFESFGVSFIIENVDGSFCAPSYFTDKVFKKQLLRDAGLSDKFRMHDCRHTHATWLIEKGVNIKIVSERSDFTLTTYDKISTIQ